MTPTPLRACWRGLGVALMLSWLGGCASQPAGLNYYLLQQAGPFDATTAQAAAARGPQGEADSLLLQRLSLASYLQQPELALLEADHRIHYAPTHLWSEPLQQGLMRALRDDLQHEGITLMQIDDPDAAAASARLSLAIDHFAASASGDVYLCGTFWLSGETAQRQRFDLELPLHSDGFAHAVGRQRQLVTKLAAAIATALR